MKNKTTPFYSRRAPLPHPPVGLGGQSKKFGGSPPFPSLLRHLMKLVQGDKSLPCISEVTFVSREGCLSLHRDTRCSVAPASAGCCWDPEELNQ